MASAFKKVKKKFAIGKGKGKRRDDDSQVDQESSYLPDAVREAHDENAPISQPSTSSQKSSVCSKTSDSKSVGGSLDSELSNLNLQDIFDQKLPKASQEGVAAATAQACGNNHQGALGVSSKPPNPNTDISRDGITQSEQMCTQVPNVPDPANDDERVSTDPNSEASGDVITHSEQTHTQVSNVPDPASTDGRVTTDLNSEASVDGITHSEETHTQVLIMPDPVNTDGRLTTDLNSEGSVDGITHSEETHTQVLNVPDPVNSDELVNPNSNNEASRDDSSNQERNAASAGRTEAPNINQEATAPFAAAATAAAAAAAETVPPQPDGTNLASLTNTPIQEESVDTVDEGATGNETTPSEEVANIYDNLYVSDVITKGKFLEDKLARELDHTSHRAIKTWEHLACTKEVNAPLETRLRCKLNRENSCTRVLIDFLSVEMGDKTVHDLIEALKAINRHDVVRIITDVYQENSTETISDFASSGSNTDMIDKIATKLDQKSRVIGYWINLGQQFKISGEKLKDIEYGQFNPTLALMEYLYSKQEHLTVGKFYKEVEKLNRRDVLKKLEPFLSEHSEKPMKDVIEPESAVMTSICTYLNNPNRVLKNWRHLASAFQVPRDLYKDFNPAKPMSPTSLLFEWIFGDRRDLTVGQLCSALKSIERNDVVRDLRKYLEEQSTVQE